MGVKQFVVLSLVATLVLGVTPVNPGGAASHLSPGCELVNGLGTVVESGNTVTNTWFSAGEVVTAHFTGGTGSVVGELTIASALGQFNNPLLKTKSFPDSLTYTFDGTETGVGIGAASFPVPGGATGTIRCAEAASLPTCFGSVATIIAVAGQPTVGTSGPDVIIGTSGPDDIRGRGGNDKICSKGGDDTVRGGPGDDQINLGSGNDLGRGGKNDDLILGKSGRDKIYGNTGEDTLKGGPRADMLHGGKHSDSLFGKSGPDALFGGRGVDACRGGPGKDTFASCNEV